MLNGYFYIVADTIINNAINDNTDDKSPNINKDNFVSPDPGLF